MSERTHVPAPHLNHPGPLWEYFGWHLHQQRQAKKWGGGGGSGRTNCGWIAMGEQVFRIQMCPWTHQGLVKAEANESLEEEEDPIAEWVGRSAPGWFWA